MKRTRALIALITIAIVGSACSTTAAETQTLRVLTHTDFELPAEALAEFTERTGVEVAIFREPDATSVVDLLARTTETPVAYPSIRRLGSPHFLTRDMLHRLWCQMRQPTVWGSTS